MKYFYLLCAFLVFSITQAQIVNIPDANFKNALVNTNCVDTDGFGGFDSDADLNNDGEIQVSEAEAVIRLNVSDQNVASLEGILAFANLESVYFNDNVISGSLDFTSLTNLVEMEGGSNQLTSINVSNLNNLTYLQLTGNNLSSINFVGSTNLVNFLAEENELTSLDFQGYNDLVNISLGNNQLTSLNVPGLVNLVSLRCFNNMLISLDLSDTMMLATLDCRNNLLNNVNLTNLNNLTSVDVSQNNLSELNLEVNPNMDALDCSDNQLTSLDVSAQTGLVIFQCRSNNLSNLTLGNLPNLESFNCAFNQLTTIEIGELSNLEILNCTGNFLTELNFEGANNLINVQTSSNPLSFLDCSSLKDLQILQCQDNQLEYLIIKNGTIETNIDISLNPNLLYVCADEEQFDSVQAVLDVNGYTNCVLNSYCSFVPGGEYYTVSGQTRFDLNANGCDAADAVYPSIKVNLTTDNGFSTFISNASGEYAIPLQTGNYTLSPILENFEYYTIAPSSVSVEVINTDITQDFCVVADGQRNDLEVIVSPTNQARPGFVADYVLIYKNKGNLPATGTINLNFNDAVMDFVSATPTIDSQTEGNLTWYFTDALPFETRTITIKMNLNTPTDPNFPLNGGDVLMFVANINPVASDETPEDNTFTLNQTVVNSFDPNDKTCLEGETITPDMVGEYVHYLIRFENTGTASAVNIVVKDVIDTDKFDISTLIPLHASHSFVTRIQNSNEVEFIFEGIQLPFDDANNDGFVTFKIKTLPGLVLGDTFANDAEIYFDYNAPIITNDYLTTVAEPLSVSESSSNEFKLHPNPATDLLHIDSQVGIQSITIYDLNGRLLNRVGLTGQTMQYQLNMSNLSKGVYFVKVASVSGEMIQKILKD
ncbi:T9SS type A sorting domain-containing protein [Subsaxibacter sp. CAU 1640]|uniref:T9SS type A sorting domain-containing protein n=1 Tax=Subsaxibacter sp. CAU 1640 TaxID=2933271 RepID=UPI002003E214|nr:T9SS type A sorting domain-containing protein [Subsaxibacter sp. CAU 1640]MCK7591693.1 T9SS type A sorting domain-containing protein [Subsaxibacter sp. CAU 1640]